MTDLGIVEELFTLFNSELEKLNLIVNEGKIIDASFIEVPRQRNSREENKQIKAGEIPDSFTQNPHKLSQKDTDARWVKKNEANYYGYKNHVKQDAKSKLITGYCVTDASVHDSQPTEGLLDESDKGEEFYADSAYTGAPLEMVIEKKGLVNRVCEKGVKNHPLTDEQKASNREKSHVRVRVEHIFGFMENSMNEMYIQCIGIKRTTAIIGLINLTYNMFRKIQLTAI